MDFPKRKSPRLSGYDYSTPGAYFITICTQGRKQLLSHITSGRGTGPAFSTLTPYGIVVEREIQNLSVRYPTIQVHKYTVMPNHIHLLLFNGTSNGNPAANICDVISSLKSLATHACRAAGCPAAKLFQVSFHDHIIRNEADYQKNLDLYRHQCDPLAE